MEIILKKIIFFEPNDSELRLNDWRMEISLSV
jgi:hypothetical protein